jgi:hypothetical protein
MRGRARTAVLSAFTAAGAAVGLGATVGQAAPATTEIVAAIDLAKAFGIRSAWHFTATQGPSQPDDVEGTLPGTLSLCITRAIDGGCLAGIAATPRPPASHADGDWEAHYLNTASIVHPRGRSAAPLLLVQTAGQHAYNGNQAVYTQLIAYRAADDRFETVFSWLTGRNNNQEVRFIATGPLRGAVIAVEPANKSPWHYWISVNRIDASYRYREMLRYRSATGYGDGNPLPVIDSEMPNIQQRLGLWRPGKPLPLPAAGCAKPRLVRLELWCS